MFVPPRKVRAPRALGAMAIAALIGGGTMTGAADADLIVFNDPSGLAAEAEFTLLNATTLEVRLRNISTGAPVGFDNSDQILTGVSWSFSDPTVFITGGSVVIGDDSESVNFDTGYYGPGSDVSGEWGYGNGGTTNMFDHFFSCMQAGTTPFGGPNLDGPSSLNGPQGGLIADPELIPVGGLGAIQDEVVATLTLSGPVANLAFLRDGVTAEFGSDAAFITIPTPGAAALLVFGGISFLLRRRGAAA
ncbi:MAG: XDD4 family exosortase-dependent surface protein [Phycisphaerales bacterium]